MDVRVKTLNMCKSWLTLGVILRRKCTRTKSLPGMSDFLKFSSVPQTHHFLFLLSVY